MDWMNSLDKGFTAKIVEIAVQSTAMYAKFFIVKTGRMSVLFLYQTVTNPVIFWNLTLLYLHSIINPHLVISPIIAVDSDEVAKINKQK
jgi:hypothetical protein